MTTRRAAFARYQRESALFSRDVIGLPLYPYQTAWVDHILGAAAEKRTETITVEMPRQSGKNEGSAQLEVQLLARMAGRGGDVVKAAPTFKPQIVNSKRRFEARCAPVKARLSWLKFRPTMGYIYECGRASIAFLSADPNASVVGATASLLMEVDEAQDVDRAKFDKDFSPMRASTGAPVAMYGTPWMDDSLLERAKQDIDQGRTPGRNFRVPWEVVAESNPAYGAYVEGEIARLGRDHPLIRTQYLLETLANKGRMLSEQQLRQMMGTHPIPGTRTNEPQVVAGLDFAGADEDAGTLSSLATGSARDSVALTIGRVDWVTIAEGIVEPVIRLLARYEWTNQEPTGMHTTLYNILANTWKVDLVHADATGIGSAPTAFLARAMNKPGREKVQAITFDGGWGAHTRIAFQYLAAVNSSRLQDYKVSFDPIRVGMAEAPDGRDVDRHAWWQRAHARLEARTGKRVRAYVPEGEGHDDLLVSEMLMVDAAHSVGHPRVLSTGRVDFYGQR